MKPTGWILVAANALPIFGVLFLGWDIHSALVLFWSENLVTGLFTVLRIAFAKGELPMKIFLIPFFLFHFGMFTAVHGVFVAFLVAGPERGLEDPFATLGALLFTVWPGVIALLVSHGASFWMNYVKGGERFTTSPDKEMMRPYNRVVTLHVTIIAAAFLLAALGSLNAKPAGFATQVPALVLVIMKILVDAASHHRSHSDRGPGPAAAPPIMP
ncbi:MAG TPA: DUF6498-containing protein [Patescibacteria group bacterium]|nr:DUF6498-containing protein [Patescibacteria group bacterium]